MKKTILILAALATLASCGGSGTSTTQQNADSANGGDAINRVSTTTPSDGTTAPDELTLLTCEMLKYIKPQTFNMRLSEEPDTAFNVKNITDYPRWTQDSPDPKTSREDSSRFYVHLDGGFDNIWKFTYRKRKSGGYWILVHLRGLSGDCGDCEYNEYNAWYYVDGKPASSVNVNDKKHYAMPNPSILSDFYANLDKFPEKAREWLKNREITKFDYEISGDKINVTLNPYCHVESIVNDDYEEIIDVLPRQLMGLEKKKDPKFPSVTYLWNGDDYVMDPKHKPLQEDLKYFQPDGGEKFAQSGKYAIQLYSGWDSDNYSEADINGDGMDDLVVCDNDYKEFAVYFKDKKGVYNRQMIGHRPPEEESDDECQLYATAKQGGINVTASYESTKEYDFHYEKGDFYLYNYSQSMEWPDDGGSDYYEIDFEKHKVIDNDSTYSVPAYPLMKIADVPLGWWTITEIYQGCDMTEIWKQIESRGDDVAGSKELKYSFNNLKYEIDVNDGHCTRKRTVHCYELEDKGGYTVIDVYGLMCETQSGTYNLAENTITQYIFKDGKLTKTELQEELKPYNKDGFETVFENERGYGFEGFKLQFLTSGGDETVFSWNGKKFEKK